MDDDVISRDEIVALLFNAGDIARSLDRIEALLREEDDGEEKDDAG